MTEIVVLGALFGVGLCLVVAGLRAHREPLTVVLARLGHPDRRTPTVARPSTPHIDTDASTMRVAALARRIGPLQGLLARSHADLRLTGRSADEQAARILIFAVLGFVLGPVVITAGFLPAGHSVPIVLPLWVAIAGGAVGALYPIWELHTSARAARAQFRGATAAFCDVSAIALASGLGVEQALTTAARTGDGWVFSELRYTLEWGRLNGLTAWDALDLTARELDLPELEELAAAVRLAGDEGAAVAATVAQKGRSLRDRLASDSERAAVAVTERMSVPGALLLVGMFIFLLYPALAAISK